MKRIFPDLGALTECLIKPGVVTHTFDPSAPGRWDYGLCYHHLAKPEVFVFAFT